MIRMPPLTPPKRGNKDNRRSLSAAFINAGVWRPDRGGKTVISRQQGAQQKCAPPCRPSVQRQTGPTGPVHRTRIRLVKVMACANAARTALRLRPGWGARSVSSHRCSRERRAATTTAGTASTSRWMCAIIWWPRR